MPVFEEDFGVAAVEGDLAAGADFSGFREIADVGFLVAPDDEVEELVGVRLVDVDESGCAVAGGGGIDIGNCAADGAVFSDVLGGLGCGEVGLGNGLRLHESDGSGEAEGEGGDEETHEVVDS